jgi:hypothetical protein
MEVSRVNAGLRAPARIFVRREEEEEDRHSESVIIV